MFGVCVLFKTDDPLGFLQQENKQMWHESVTVVSVRGFCNMWKGHRAERLWSSWGLFRCWMDGLTERQVLYHGHASFQS